MASNGVRRDSSNLHKRPGTLLVVESCLARNLSRSTALKRGGVAKRKQIPLYLELVHGTKGKRYKGQKGARMTKCKNTEQVPHVYENRLV